jgi:hypothetical protein
MDEGILTRELLTLKSRISDIQLRAFSDNFLKVKDACEPFIAEHKPLPEKFLA